mgnify:CR=1 FL=1
MNQNSATLTVFLCGACQTNRATKIGEMVKLMRTCGFLQTLEFKLSTNTQHVILFVLMNSLPKKPSIYL